MKLSFDNVNVPPSPKLIKWLSAVTLATASLPVWINEIPLEMSDMTKAMIEWCFKGVNILLSIIAVFTKDKIEETVVEPSPDEQPIEE